MGMKIKEIMATTANKMAHSARDIQFEEYKQQLAKRITKSANDGKFSLCIDTYVFPGAWDGLKQWLESLGFVVDCNSRNLMATIKWDDLSVIKIDMMTEPKQGKTRIVNNPLGWEFISPVAMFHCPHCSGYSKTPTPYCPNCGTKMKKEG